MCYIVATKRSRESSINGQAVEGDAAPVLSLQEKWAACKDRMLPEHLALIAYRFWQVVASHIG